MEHSEIFKGRDLTEFAGSDGFVTDRGRYVDRDEASGIAYAARQLRDEAQKMADAADRFESPLAAEDLKIRGAGDIPAGFDPLLGGRTVALDDIPKRDARGRFLKKEERLAMLDQKIREEQLANQENRGQKDHKDTQEISSRIPKNDLGMTSDYAKDINLLDQDTQDIEKALDLSPDEITALRENIKAEAGDQPGREKGIVEGIKCIIRNLV